MKTQIKRRCACGCGEVTNYGKRYIYRHGTKGMKLSKETKHKMSLSKH